jgi:hypothetical protein
MATTGEKCTTTGLYSGRCTKGHHEQGHFQTGDVFTPCSTANCGGQSSAPVRGSPMTWTWLRSR